MKLLKMFAIVAVLALSAACAGESSKTETVQLSPTAPSTGGGAAPVLTAPAPDSPSDNSQLGTLRPTLTVRNGTSTVTGTRVYEFQISDRSDFTIGANSVSPYFVVVLTKTGVPEDATGKTSFTPDADLQPATKMFWRTRVTQSGVTSDWSAAWSFRTKVTGYNRAGEVFDPLIGETIGARVGNTAFVSGKGLQINDANSWVRYPLVQTITTGEFSVDVENLVPNNPQSKARIFSMMDGGNNLFNSDFLFNVQYRGVSGNPDNCISFKAVFGNQAFKLEPDINRRTASVTSLNPSKTYLWKATWGPGIRLIIYDGGSTGTGVGGTLIYDYEIISPGGSYNPNPHVAYLGANNGPFGQESGSFPGAIYRNLWIGNRARPTSLGSALDPQ